MKCEILKFPGKFPGARESSEGVGGLSVQIRWDETFVHCRKKSNWPEIVFPYEERVRDDGCQPWAEQNPTTYYAAWDELTWKFIE